MSNTTIRAIANPAPWSDAPELPRVDWETATYLAAPMPLRFSPPRRPGTHCRNGHPYDEGNVYVNPTRGYRRCRTCLRESNRRFADRARRQRPSGNTPTRERTYCPQGHPYDEENTYIHPTRGVRICRECKAGYMARYQRRQRAATSEPIPARQAPSVRHKSVDNATTTGAKWSGEPAALAPPEDSDLSRARARIAARRARREGAA